MTVEEADGVHVLRVDGHLDGASSAAFQEAALKAVEEGASRVVLDIENVEFVSSAGLRGFLVLAKAVTAKRGKLALAGANKNVESVLRTCGFSTFLRIADSVASARTLVSCPGSS